LLSEADSVDGRSDERAVGSAETAKRAAARDAPGGDHLLHGHGRLDADLGALGEIADAKALSKTRGRLAEEIGRTLLRLLEAEEDAKQRRRP
jgi:hypothetical protein